MMAERRETMKIALIKSDKNTTKPLILTHSLFLSFQTRGYLHKIASNSIYIN